MRVPGAYCCEMLWVNDLYIEHKHNSTQWLLIRCFLPSSELRRGTFAHICQPAAAWASGGAAAGGNAHRCGEQSGQTSQRQGRR